MQDRNYELCDTIFYQGMFGSQAQAVKYVGSTMVKATTGEYMWCNGRNNLAPLNVIPRLYIGKEIADVNLQPFSSYWGMLNPVNWLGVAFTWASNRLNGFKFAPAANPTPASVVFHAPVVSKFSVGQKTDTDSHQEKYLGWLAQENRTEGLILYGVSRGTAATFCAFANNKYSEVKLVILEGAIDSVENIIPKRVKSVCKSKFMTDQTVTWLKRGLSFFTSYNSDGQSPLSCVDDYPEGVPTVFITSKVDAQVPCENTERIATALAERGKNDVYLLKLERSSHPNYMFDDKDDRDMYENFIQAIYKTYGLHHDAEKAGKGEAYIEGCKLGCGSPKAVFGR